MKNQIHNKFKFFTVECKDNKLSAKSKKEIVEFTNSKKVTPKSIGVEYIESSSILLISIGYIEKKCINKFDISTKRVGKFTSISDIEKIEKSMEKVASKITGIICHEFFTTISGDMYSIFLTAK